MKRKQRMPHDDDNTPGATFNEKGRMPGQLSAGKRTPEFDRIPCPKCNYQMYLVMGKQGPFFLCQCTRSQSCLRPLKVSQPKRELCPTVHSYTLSKSGAKPVLAPWSQESSLPAPGARTA